MTRLFPLAALLLAGCASVGHPPSPASADAALPDAFALLDRERAAAGTIDALLPARDPAYAILSQRALADAPTVQQALARIDAARAGARAARAEQFPTLNGSATVTRERLNQQQFGALPPGISISPNRTSYDGDLNASWDADLFGRLRASRQAALARLDAADADAAGVRLSLQADIGRAVIDARTLDAREKVARADIASATDLVAVTRVRARAGIAPEFDVIRAQSLAADVESRLAPILSQRAAVIGQLVTLAGVPAQEVQDALRTDGALSTGAMPALAIPSVVLRGRPDVAAAERRLAAADREIAAAAAERYPRLSVTAALGLFTLGLSNLFDDRSLTGSVGAGLAGPLLDFGRVGARIDQRQAEAREAFATYRYTLFKALGEVEAALGALSAADRRAASLERQAALDLDAAKLARERYRRGLDTFLTVIDAERTTFASRANAIDAAAEALRTRVTLYRAVGGSPKTQHY